jgi:hypothetical protein
VDLSNDGVLSATEEEMVKQTAKCLDGEKRKEDKPDDLMS